MEISTSFGSVQVTDNAKQFCVESKQLICRLASSSLYSQVNALDYTSKCTNQRQIKTAYLSYNASEHTLNVDKAKGIRHTSGPYQCSVKQHKKHQNKISISSTANQESKEKSQAYHHSLFTVAIISAKVYSLKQCDSGMPQDLSFLCIA